MHDIAGCRVIFQDFDQLYEFRDLVHNGSFEHKRRASEDDRWNYIENPKSSGYRGIHDVYSYHVTPKVRKAREKQPWNGMLVEIQYRTHVQHAWATAVELVGLVTESDPKFDRGNPDFIEFFKLSSEILARSFENMTSCYPDLENIRGAATACPCAAKRCMRSVAQVIRSSRNLSRRRVHRLPFATRCLAEHAA